jgi:hypothetical protein
MLVPDWLAVGELHWMHAEPGGAKTWIALWLARRVLVEGGTVVWTDEEIDVDEMAKRLLLLGADPDAIERRFVYFPYPGWEATPEDVKKWAALVRAVRPDLVVIDTATDALAEAGLDENSGIEVTQWIKACCEPPRREGSAVLVLDHVVKAGTSSGRGYAIGSRAKKAKAKVMYELGTVEEFGPGEIGIVNVKRVKNGVGASIPKERSMRIGDEMDTAGEEQFVLEEIVLQKDNKDSETKTEKARQELKKKLLEVVKEHSPIKAAQARGMVRKRNETVADVLAELAEDDLYPVKAEKEGTGVVYIWISNNGSSETG